MKNVSEKLVWDKIESFNNEDNIEIDFEDYSFSKLKIGIKDDSISTKEINEIDMDTLASVGVNINEDSDSGKYLLFGEKNYVAKPQFAGVEILPIKEALETYPEIMEKYFFKAMETNKNRYTKAVSETVPKGYFIRVKKNVKIKEPLHAGLFMHEEMSAMSLHNIVVLEEGAHLHLITGCTANHTLKGGLHVVVSEQYVGKNAKFINTMIHNWGPEFIVRPSTATVVEKNGFFVNNYYSIKPPRNIKMDPFTHLKGENATAKYMSILFCLPDTHSNIGGTVLMTGENSAAELVARAVNYGGTIVQTGLLIGAAKNTRAHVDCSGLMLSDSGIIEAIPGLRAMHPDARMSHEAAIGKIDTGEVNYLQSKGLDEMQAIALIIRGFLDIGIEGLSPEMEKTIKEIAELSGHGEE
ncbi:MAG: SufD family Fe-S cluster assembly protein [Bacteroidales bacterium]|jgi:hypothetical protein|nr:SufD family Fe-S cluster assembly protein [Bacteroidales bacterium]